MARGFISKGPGAGLIRCNPPGRRYISVKEGLQQGGWIKVTKGAFSAKMIYEFSRLWISTVGQSAIMSETMYEFCWICTDSGICSAKMTYLAFFEGLTCVLGAEKIWTSAAPLRHKFLVGLPSSIDVGRPIISKQEDYNISRRASSVRKGRSQ